MQRKLSPVFLKLSFWISPVFWLVSIIFDAFSYAIDVPTFHLDGAFQTASSLYRLDLGQLPGRDFLPYLGIGPTMVLYPCFTMFGSNISASVISSMIVTKLLACVVTATLIQLVFPAFRFGVSVALGGAILLGCVFLTELAGLNLPSQIQFAIEPGNSLRPIRAFLPYLLMLYYFLINIRYPSNLKQNIVLAAVATGSSIVWSNDFAIVSCFWFIVLVAVRLANASERPLSNIISYLAVSGLTGLFTLYVLTGGHPQSIIQYNFRDVAKDQWWYFPYYSENYRILVASDFKKLLTSDFLFPFLTLILVGLLALWTRRPKYWLLSWLGMALLSGGTVASIGGNIAGYYGGANFWAVLVLILLGASTLSKNKILRRIAGLTWFNMALRLGVVGLSISASISSVLDFRGKTASAKADPNRIWVAELGGFLGREWADYLNLARSHTSKKVFEEYWGIWSAVLHKIPPSPVDSLIHSLGSVRESAVNVLSGDSDFVITTKYETSPTWQPWSLSQNYWFYSKLIEGWKPFFISPTTVLWERSTSQPSSLNKSACEVNRKTKREFSLNGVQPGFYEVELRYFNKCKGRSLLLFQNNISFGGDAEGFVSIDPSTNQTKIPVYSVGSSRANYSTKFICKNSPQFEIISCSAKRIDRIDRSILHSLNIGEVDRWRGCELVTQIGSKTSDCKLVKKKASSKGFLNYGPYARLLPGTYSFKVQYSSPNIRATQIGKWDVIVSPINGKEPEVLADGEIFGSAGHPDTVSGFFSVKSGSETFVPIEVRSFLDEGSAIQLEYLEIGRIN